MLTHKQIKGKLNIIGECWNVICKGWKLEERKAIHRYVCVHLPTKQIVHFIQERDNPGGKIDIIVFDGKGFYDFGYLFDNEFATRHTRTLLLNGNYDVHECRETVDEQTAMARVETMAYEDCSGGLCSKRVMTYTYNWPVSIVDDVVLGVSPCDL